jgi:hypothetical protein
MGKTTLPEFNMDTSETGCCPRFDPAGWDGEEFELEERRFVRVTTRSFLHIPLNIGSVFKKTFAKIVEADAQPKDSYLILSNELSPWRAEHLLMVTKDVPGAEMVTLSGTFLSKVFEGPYQEAKHWCKEMQRYVEAQGRKTKTPYFFYTTCPKCLKHWGKNYVVGFYHVEA